MSSNAQRNTVLIVDDTPDSLMFLMDTVERDGMTVLVANRGADALELLEHITPDLILMDAIMPQPDGFETTRQIKMNPAWAHIPIIFMTGLTETEHVIKALDVGGVDYVRKPIVIEELLARIRVHLGNARVSHQSRLALDATGRHLISVDSAGTLLWFTPQAEKLLATLSEDWNRQAPQLPAVLGGPLQTLIAETSASGMSITIDLPNGALEMVLADRSRPDEILIRLNEQRKGAELDLLRQRYSLTHREAEVLLWVSFGKPNRVISEILGISPRTVNKHLEQIFEKLGVETRAAATAFAVRTMSADR